MVGTAPGLNEEVILEALRGVHDPELHRDIVGLGMVHDLAISDGIVSMKLVLTTPACPLRETIERDVRAALIGPVAGITDIAIDWGADVRPLLPREDGPQPIPGVRNIIAVGSNKGGVGKSTVSVNMALALAYRGARVGLLDADITGPNVPTMLGLTPGFQSTEGLQVIDCHGLRVASIGFVLPRGTPVVWRGPMIGTGVRQMLHDVSWGELDYLIIDLPPGTSDASMSMAQGAPLSGAVIVSTPQDVAVEDAAKAIAMFEKLQVPVFGIIENMSYFLCPHCGERTEIFGHGGAAEAAEEYGIDFLGELPIDIAIRQGGDMGAPIVLTDPESAQAKAIIAIAERVAAKVSVAQYLAGAF